MGAAIDDNYFFSVLGYSGDDLFFMLWVSPDRKTDVVVSNVTDIL